MRAKYGSRTVVSIDDLNLDQEDYKRLNGRRFVISKGKVIVVIGSQDYNLDNMVMDEEFTRYIHKDNSIYNFSRSNIINRPRKQPKTKVVVKRFCKDCGLIELKPKHQYCSECAISRRYKK